MANTFPRSTVNLYTTKIKPSSNVYIDDIDVYLMDCTFVSLICQYIKHGLNIKLKLNMGEGNQTNFMHNYVRITNWTDVETQEAPMYYFINSIRPVSENTIELDLTMDTVNSLGRDALSPANPRNFSEKTHIERQHMDRWQKPNTWDPTVGGYLYRLVDKESEGTVPSKLKASDTKLTITGSDVDWYLLYSTGTAVDPNYPDIKPIVTELVASSPINAGVPSTGASKTFTAADFTEDGYYYFLSVDNPGGNMNGHNLGDTINKATDFYATQGGAVVSAITAATLKAYVLHVSNGSMTYSCLFNTKLLSPDYRKENTYYSNDGANSLNQHIGDYTLAIWTPIASITTTQANIWRFSTLDYTSTVANEEALKDTITDTRGIFVGTGTAQTLDTIDNVNRTDPKYVKIIKYPYCPIAYTKSSSYYNFGNNWTYNNGRMRFTGTGIPALGNEGILRRNIGEMVWGFGADEASIGFNKYANASYESKLFHSDFYNLKLTYDSFSSPIYLENLTVYNAIDGYTRAPQIDIDFKPTSTINSRFAFKWGLRPWDVINQTGTSGNYKDTDDYSKYLVVTRNNEEVILNNEYLNYIKTGFNYDKKANALQAEQAQRQAITSAATGAVGVGAGILGVMAAANPVLAGVGLAASAVGAAISTANAWQNYNNLVAQQDNAMQKKQAELSNQATTVAGSDDVDLMSYYCGNRLHLIKYQPNDLVRNALFDALRLTGYSHNDYAKPATDTRVWYNYIKCDPVLTFESKDNLQVVLCNDLKERYKQGVTILHHHEMNNGSKDVNVWDFEQQYENFETWLVEGVN